MGLLYALTVPGFAVVGLMRLTDPSTEAALSLVSSIVLCTAAAQMLVWLGWYSLAAALGVLTVLTTGCLLAQLRAEATVPGNRAKLLWPRSYWS